jgi:hypothetical protein
MAFPEKVERDRETIPHRLWPRKPEPLARLVAEPLTALDHPS